uniref:Uncharacterized protein n=1 Tax=viral metagenome TaxID=1070528 RepID=A0A6C0I6R9_9ZZZZ
MSSFNTSTTHPLIPNSNQYYIEKKFVSIHSEDRDILKYPNADEFEIEFPQDYLNVQTVKLSTWTFPANYNVFSPENYNVSMTFKFLTLYNPGENGYADPLTEAIFAGLYNYIGKEYLITIETGFYNPDQMATELTNKFNEGVTKILTDFFTITPAYNYALALFTSYDRFKIVYNSVGQRMWFGNTADKFELTNNYINLFTTEIVAAQCLRKDLLRSTSNWGLPSYLGFTRCPATSLTAAEIENNANTVNNIIFGIDPDIVNIVGGVPRFFYGDVTPGDNGFWLLPTLPGAIVYFLQAPAKINFMGPAYIYMEIDGLNCIDETSPYTLTQFTTHTNQTNGRVNSAFAKIAVPTTPISQWFDSEQAPFKYFNPPAERIRKIKCKLRYHNGQKVNFGLFEYSFMLEFTLLRPQNERKYIIVM